MSNYETTAKIVIGFAMALSIAPLAIVAVNGQVYEDAISEFMEANGQIINMYEVHEDGAITMTSTHDNSGLVLYEDEIGEYLANAGFNMVEFTPEGGRNGELLIVANPILSTVGISNVIGNGVL
jgi:hypothetical protein